ncbi:MAG: hypothetical protein ABJN65_09845 [Parasphingorhabdus sp.]
MNFPHKGPKAEADLDLSAEDQQQSDYNALMARVIARQSLSHSARKVFAHEMQSAAANASNQGRSLHNRIRFFAGQSGNETETENKNLFVRGHFRPDLADKTIVESGARGKV